MIGLQKLWNMFLFYRKGSFLSGDFQIFVFPPSLLFIHVSHCLRAWSKINHKVYDVINCLNKNLITHFVWYLEKEKRYVETLVINAVLYKEHFYGKIMQKILVQMLFPDPFFVLVHNPKKLLHARSSFQNKIFWKGIIKNL